MRRELLQADLAFMGADAVDLDGNTYADDLQVVNLDRKMAACAARMIVVADSGKFGRTGMCRIFRPSDYSLIVSDAGIAGDVRKRFGEQGIEVKVAAGDERRGR